MTRPLLTLLFAALAPAAAADPPGLAARAEAALADRFPTEAHRLRVRLVRTGGDVPGADRLLFPADGALPRGHAQVDVLDASGQEAGWALLYVAHYDSVVVARRRLGRGEPVGPADLAVAWTETTRFRGEPLRAADLRALGPDLFADRPLVADRPLRRGDLRPPFAADTGDPVRMRYRRGPLRLELPCTAREPGYAGEAVRLHCPDTRATYRARLTAPGRADWLESL
ncbi:MAG: flagellar basal body P-ring formation chaperone FlgA [Rhodothermales bacterium]|nr:flagellar basal body P-ring formation chaperone FlgA [Rhodothermales bacterium]